MITMYYDDTCTLCATNAITMQQKAPNKIAIVPTFGIRIIGKASYQPNGHYDLCGGAR